MPFGRIPIVLLTVVGLLLISSPPATASTYLRTAHDGKIWEVTSTGVTWLAWEDWAARGFPAYSAAPTRYQKVLDIPTVYAVTDFGVGAPQIDTLTYPQYQSLGSPRVTSVAWMPNLLNVIRWGTSTELFAVDTGNYFRKLTSTEWDAAGQPAFQSRSGSGFIQMAWDSRGGVAYMCDSGIGYGGRIDYARWVRLGAPTPYRLMRSPGDAVYTIVGGSDPAAVYYAGPATVDLGQGPVSGQHRQLSFAEWQEMGSPVPSPLSEPPDGFAVCSPEHGIPERP